MTETVITIESPESADGRALIGEIDALYATLYPSESIYTLDLAALCDPSVSFFIARVGGSAAGSIGLQVLNDYAEIKRLYVRCAYRGRGLGRLLVEQVVAYAREQRIDLLRLETGIRQPEAIKLYERAGFVQIGPFGDYPADPLSLFYERKL